MKREYYKNSISQFTIDDNEKIFGQLCENHEHDLNDQQKNAWRKQIEYLKLV
jgi:hypothetical protein